MSQPLNFVSQQPTQQPQQIQPQLAAQIQQITQQMHPMQQAQIAQQAQSGMPQQQVQPVMPQQQPQQSQVQQPYNPEPEAMRNLMVNYIPTNIDEMQLRQLFERFGPIENIKIVCDRETQQSRGYGFVKFASAASAQQAINELNGYNILNKRLKVALAAAGNQRNRPYNQPRMNPGGMGYYGAQFGGYQAAPYAMTPNQYPNPQQMMAMQQQYMMQQAAAQQQQQQQ
uniref:RRM domain-containing protein n=1 Tax=Lygus hesperus TaxID=30085 RepID=A0A0A9YPE0_LYGHE